MLALSLPAQNRLAVTLHLQATGIPALWKTEETKKTIDECTDEHLSHGPWTSQGIPPVLKRAALSHQFQIPGQHAVGLIGAIPLGFALA